MAESELRRKRRTLKSSDLFVAIKSKNEIYYQMASIFKQASFDEDNMAKEVVTGLLTKDPAKGSIPEVSWKNF